MTDNAERHSPDVQDTLLEIIAETVVSDHDTLKYHLLGPSLTKAGQDSVDQQKVNLHNRASNLVLSLLKKIQGL